MGIVEALPMNQESRYQIRDIHWDCNHFRLDSWQVTYGAAVTVMAKSAQWQQVGNGRENQIR